MTNELQLIVKENKLPEDKTKSLLASFGGYFNKAHEVVKEAMQISVTDETQGDLMLKAREARLSLKDIRVEAEKTRVTLKEQSLREGRAIDGINNLIKALIMPAEEYLEKQEKFAEFKEKERLAKRNAERIAKLSFYVEDITLYNLEGMSDDAFDKLLAGCKLAYDAQKAAEKKAEEERIAKEKAEAKENERIRLENEKLKEEAIEKQKKIDAENKIRDEKLEKEREEQEEKLKKEREAKEKLEREIKEKKEAEEARIKAEEELKRKELLAPDKEKLLSLADRMDLVKLPVVESREAGMIIKEVENRVSEIASYIREKAKTL